MLCIHSIPTYLAICFALLLGTTSAAPAPGPSPVQKPFSSFPNSQSLVSASIPRTRFCGQQPNKNKTNDDLARTLVSARRAQIFATHDVTGLDASRQLASQNKMVPVVWHVVTDGGTGNLTMGQIEAQVEGLNSDYGPHGFTFNLTNVNRVNNATWFNYLIPDTPFEQDMKGSLRQGGKETLNLYTVAFPNDLLGYATFPFDYDSNPQRDGVVFLYSTVPGGREKGYNMGKTATHEVGHWLGLYHTFQGGCSGKGDDVSDTPPQATPTTGCLTQKDTCPGGGADAVHNYMDYSSDACLDQFTEGQSVRMSALTSHYRGL